MFANSTLGRPTRRRPTLNSKLARLTYEGLRGYSSGSLNNTRLFKNAIRSLLSSSDSRRNASLE